MEKKDKTRAIKVRKDVKKQNKINFYFTHL